MTSGELVTLEQKRAQHAWQVSAKYHKEEVNFAKGLPALLMNSGLMQVLAFCHEKGGAAENVAAHLRAWLKSQFPKTLSGDDFGSVMTGLLNAPPEDYQAVVAEAFAWLRWLRQMASARNG